MHHSSIVVLSLETIAFGGVRVTRAVRSRQDNVGLEDKASRVAGEESSLPHPYRSALAQLRSGFCPSLNSFLVRMGRAPNDLCPPAGQSLTPANTTTTVFSSRPNYLSLTCGNDLAWLRTFSTLFLCLIFPLWTVPHLSRLLHRLPCRDSEVSAPGNQQQ